MLLRLLFLSDADFYITRVGGNAASASRKRVGNADATRVGLHLKDLFAEQASRNVSRVGFNVDL